jgi:hypothetical protein
MLPKATLNRMVGNLPAAVSEANTGCRNHSPFRELSATTAGAIITSMLCPLGAGLFSTILPTSSVQIILAQSKVCILVKFIFDSN